MASTEANRTQFEQPESELIGGKRLLAWLEAQPMSRRRWQIFVLCSICLVIEAFDLQVLGLVAPIIARQWSITPQVLGLVISAALVGLLLGSLIFGMLSDVIGRRPVMQLTIGLATVFCGLCSLAGNAVTLGALRIFTGLGIGGALPTTTVVMSETMPGRRRGALIAIWSAVFPVGGFLAAAVAAVVLRFGWHWMFIAGAIPCVVVLAIRKIVPETPYFLVARGQEPKARRSVRKLVAAAIPARSADEPADSSPDFPAKAPVSRLFRGDMRKRSALVGAIWFCWLLPYYGLTLWLPTLLAHYRGFSAQHTVAFVLGFQAAGIVGRVAMFPLVDKLGRKPVMIVAAAAAAAMELVFGRQGSPLGLIVAGYVLAFFHDGGFDAVLPYAPELYPTGIRATAVGWANALGRLAAIIGTGLVGFVVAGLGITAVFVVFAASFCVVSLVVAVFGIETRKVVLHDIA